MTQGTGLLGAKFDTVEEADLFSGGVHNAVKGLSQMAGREITISRFDFRRIAVNDIPQLFGGPEALIVAVYLAISGYASGHMIVAYTRETAFRLIDLLIGQPPGSTTELSEMEQSALGEMGNIMGSFFLSHVSDTAGVSLQPSPPAVMMDMAGAILDPALASMLERGDYTYVVDTMFGTGDRDIAGTFLITPVAGAGNGNG